MSPTAIGSGLGGAVGSGLMAKPGNFSSDFDDFVYEEQDAPNRKQKKAGPGYRPGIDPEFTYFNQGGLASSLSGRWRDGYGRRA